MTPGRGRIHGAARGLASILVTLLGLLAVTFVIGRVVPVDPALTLVGDRAGGEILAAARAQWGFDQPLWRQFLSYGAAVFQGDLGTSILTGRPVLEDVARVFPATLELASVALALGVGLGVPAGVLAAWHQGRWIDQGLRLFGLLGYSVPVFWLGLMGLAVFYARLDWVPGPGRLDVLYEGLVAPRTGVLVLDALLAGEPEVARNALAHLVLPAGILGLFSMASLCRMTRSLMLEQLRQEYILTARLKGLSEARVVWRHALGNAAVPLVTVIALSYASLLEGSVLTEIVFSWPGLGFYITNSLLNADMNAVLGGTLVVGVVFIGLNRLSDALYRWLDPRTRLE
ncbi:ABC transporter permease [Pararhodospirillum photometricum]|uniref:ABC transporter permease n=1 Tax=Pararhodospirillum photometricum TaxID=1084 RepID=UPI0003182A04|nr:ABC transporter permease [Pararhodospirillum photometricum]